MPPFSIDPDKDTICDVIRHWADIQPDAPALLSEDRAPLTYSALTAQMDKIREALNASGLGRGDRVGIIHSGGSDMASLLLGVISGATAVPLDPRQTVSEYAIQLCDRNARALIAESGVSQAAVDAARQLGLSVLETQIVESGGEEKVTITAKAEGAPAQPDVARRDDIALIFGTSGTTDRSKIVPRKHRHLLARAALENTVYEMMRDDVGILIRPLYYSGSFNHVPAALFSGGSFVVLSSFEPAAFFRLCLGSWGDLVHCGTDFSESDTYLCDGEP